MLELTLAGIVMLMLQRIDHNRKLRAILVENGSQM